jgi:dTDP-4-dehydrorhamnose reductase
MNIYVFGANGMLGNYVKKYLSKDFNVIPLSRKEFDLNDLTCLEKFKLNSNDIVINCAGAIPQRNENNNSYYYKLNAVFPILLGQICEKFNSKFIHITTDCVFSGNDGNYNELSIHDSPTDYGRSKSLGELCNATIIRTSIIGEELYNKKSLLEWVKSNSGKEIHGFVNHYWNGVTCLELSKIIHKIISENLFWKGVRHIFSPRSASKYELVSMINEVYSLRIIINKLESSLNDKSLSTIYFPLFIVADILDQIKELSSFSII